MGILTHKRLTPAECIELWASPEQREAIAKEQYRRAVDDLNRMTDREMERIALMPKGKRGN
jgi:uncharacterized protein YjiS (DUF1127 family)